MLAEVLKRCAHRILKGHVVMRVKCQRQRHPTATYGTSRHGHEPLYFWYLISFFFKGEL